MKMTTFGKMVLALGMVVLMVATAQAQEQRKGRGFGFGFGGPGGGGGAMLVGNKGVQQEIKATDAQAEKLNALAQEIGEKQREQFQKLRDLSQEERREKMAEMTQATNAELRKSLGEILKPEQVKRFEQIQLQQAGLAAFATPRVQEALKVTDAQKSKFDEINAEQRQAMGDLFQGGRPAEGAMQKMAELRKKGMEKALAVLTDDQKKTWKEMTGEPFEVRFERRPNN